MPRRKKNNSGIDFSSLLSALQTKRTFYVIPVISLFILLALAYNFKGVFLVATVNNQPISRLALDQALEKQGGQAMVENMILETLITQEGKKKNVNISPGELAVKISEIEAQFQSQGQTLDAFLASRGQTRKDIEKQIKTQLMVEKMLGDQSNVTDEEIKDYYDKNKSFFPKDATLESQKEEIKNMLAQQKLSTAFQSWAENLKNEAKIQYFVNF